MMLSPKSRVVFLAALTMVLSVVATHSYAASKPKPPKPPTIPRGMEPFAPLFEQLTGAGQSKVSTACGAAVAPWAYRGRSHGNATALRTYVSAKADQAWTSAFASALMRAADWDSIWSCHTPSKLCTSAHDVPLVVVEFHASRSIFALLDFERRCAQLFRAGQPLGTMHFADRADSLFEMVQSALPNDTLFQALTLPPERSESNLEGRPIGLDTTLVEVLPVARVRNAPAYPEDAREARVQGTVYIQALVGQDGSVRDAFVISSIPKLDNAALDAIWTWRFDPASSGGKPVAVWVAIPIKFSLH